MSRDSIWINVCEASADAYGALLMRELKALSPELEIMGMGGEAMRAQGLNTVYRAEQLSLVGLTEVFTALPRIAGYLWKINKILKKTKPRAMVLIDAPDFNFHLARMAARLNIPVIYYIAPQVWAWRKSRIRFLKKYVNKIVCIFPFEQSFFQDQDVPAVYVGHPLLELMDLDQIEGITPLENQIAILPGSRKKEITSLLPVFTSVAERLHRIRPDLNFGIVRAPGISREFLLRHTRENSFISCIEPEKRHQYLKKSLMAMAASGTITLECAILEVPAIVAYKLSWTSYLAGRLLVDVPYISMPNLILGRAVYPEFIQQQAGSESIYREALRLLSRPEEREKMCMELLKIKSLLGEKKATQACARLILDTMSSNKTGNKR